MKIAGLKYWVGRNWSRSYFSKGLEALSPVAVKFLGPKQIENSDLPISTQNEIERLDLTSPVINSPKSANYFFHKNLFFSNEKELETEEGKLTIFRNCLNKEIEAFTKIVTEKEFITSCKSTKQFWIKNSKVFPILFKLTLILLNINSSSACIERYFSICGFISNKKSGNINNDLFVSKCLLRSNISLLNELNQVAL